METVKFFGPPGTGKTYTLLGVMEQELKKTAPDRIAFLTFTVAARKVAINRVLERFPHLTKDDLPYFRTLHAICYHELNMTMGGMVKGADDMKELAERLGLQFTYKLKQNQDLMMEIPYGGEAGDRLLQIDHVRRHRMQDLEAGWRCQFDDDLDMRTVRRFVHEYAAWKKREGLRDFTDLLEQASEPLDIDVCIVDEAQDLSVLQWDTLHRLTQKADRVYLAGDDDQAIFTWAGADQAAFLRHSGKPIVLPQSRRVPAAIQPLALKLVEKIKARQPKKWAPRPGDPGRLTHAGDGMLPSFEEPGDYLVLYRQHYLVRDMEQHVRTLGLPYTRADLPAPGAEWGKAILTWERLRKGKPQPERDIHFMLNAMTLDPQVKKKLSRLDRTAHYSLPDLELDENRPWFEALEKINLQDRQYLRALVRRHGAEGLTQKPKIHLSTIHAAKGSERDHVVLLTEVSPRVREVMQTDPDIERRVFYVGVTRAKQSLTLVGLDNPLL